MSDELASCPCCGGSGMIACGLCDAEPQSIPSEREEIVTYLKACTPSREFHDSDFSQGVIRGFEICIAQIEEGHHLSTRQALEQGSAK